MSRPGSTEVPRAARPVVTAAPRPAAAGRTAPTRADPELAPTFSVPPVLLDALGPPIRPAGVVLGADPDGEPVAVSLVRPAPTRVVLLGGLYLARQVTLRTVGTGARAVLVTGRPPVWEAVRRAGEPEDGPETASAAPDDPGATVRVVREQPPDLAVPDPGGPPLLVVYDRGATARGPAPARRPRQTTLVVLPSAGRRRPRRRRRPRAHPAPPAARG